mmetsp:Transcript_9200/g.34372  ORF Transcript_9200/g.34372 Transcript_9200/m.34372 type:complete len:253 (-) Transcript_9200:1717-2475(-)
MSSHTMFKIGPLITAPRNKTTLGCRIPCIILISPANSSTDSPVTFLLCICFNATSVPFQSAVNTSPKLPAPTRRPTFSSSGGMTHRPAACRSARCAAGCGSMSTSSPSAGSSPSADPEKGASFAEVLPTPPGFLRVGVGAYSTVDASPVPPAFWCVSVSVAASSRVSSRNLTFREPFAEVSPAMAPPVAFPSPPSPTPKISPRPTKPNKPSSLPFFFASELVFRNALPLAAGNGLPLPDTGGTGRGITVTSD